MGELKRINKSLCSKCQYRTLIGSCQACNYMAITGRSRIFQNGEAVNDPKFCDKFKAGDQIIPRVDAVFVPTNYDEFEDYKYVKIRRERSKYEYKDRQKRIKQGN